jgi:hypothetical protein
VRLELTGARYDAVLVGLDDAEQVAAGLGTVERR